MEKKRRGIVKPVPALLIMLLAAIIYAVFLALRFGREPGYQAPGMLPPILYDVPPEAMPAAKEAGFEIVHLFSSRQTLDQAVAYLEAAEQAGLKVMQNMPSAHLHDAQEFWIAWVSKLAGYDNLALWYLPEEPRPGDVEALQRLQEIVRKYDPQGRPSVLFFGTTHLEGWCGISDIMLVPAYPDYHGFPRTVVRAWLDIARDACLGQPIGSVLALFDSTFDGTGDRPSPREARGDAYTAVIAGTDGLAWYSYTRGVNLASLWAAVQGVVGEIQTLAPVLGSSEVGAAFQARVLSGPTQSPEFEGRGYESLQILQKVHGGSTYLLTTNLADAVIEVEFRGPAKDPQEVLVLFEDRQLQMVDGAFTDSFDPAAAHVYRIRRR